MPRTATAPQRTEEGTPEEWVDLLRSALLRDLPAMARLAAELPTGGLPRAGHLADHGYVVCEALEQHLRHTAQPDRQEPGEGAGGADLAAALGETRGRLDRLYSSERPGGLDHIDIHLSRLHAAAKRYFAAPGPGGAGSSQRWWSGWGPRQRARTLAWALAGSSGGAGPLVRSQPIATRVLLRLWYGRRAAARAALLGFTSAR